MKNFFEKLNRLWVAVLIVLILALCIRYYKFSCKTDMFLDEYLSIIISNCHETPDGAWLIGIRSDSVSYTGKELKQLFLTEDNSLPNILKDIRQMRYFTRDAPQTNLYYSLLRLSLFKAGGGEKDIMNRAFALNLIFFLFSFILLYKLANKIIRDKVLIVCALAVAFLTPASVGNTMFFRPYQLQEAIFILFSYIVALNYLKISKGNLVDTWKNMLLLAFVTALAFLSGYFAVFLVVIFYLLLLYFSVKYQQKSNISFYGYTFILSYIIVLAIYVGYNYGFTAERANESFGKLNSGVILQNIASSFSGLFNQVCEFCGEILVILVFIFSVVGAFIVTKRKGDRENKVNNQKILLALVICSLVWMSIVMYFAPYKDIRYVVAVLPIVSLIIPFVLGYFDSKKQIAFTIVFVILFVGQTMQTQKLNRQTINVDAEYIKNEDVPLIVVKSKVIDQVSLIPFYTDNRRIGFSFSIERLASLIEEIKDVYVLVPIEYPDSFTLLDRYIIKQKYKVDDCFELYRIESN